MGEPSEYMGVSVAPDGGRIAFSLLDAGTGVGDIWMQDLENGLRTRVSFGTNDEYSPLWRSDSESILYGAVNNNERYLMAKSLGGRGSEEKLAPMAFGSNMTSLNDQYLIYDVEEGSHQTIMVLPLADGSEPIAIGGANESESGSTWGGELSPDGRWLAYASDETGRAEIYIMPFPEGGGRWQVSPSGGEEIAWRADGKELFYLGLDGSLMAADIRLSQDNLQVGTVRNLFRIPTATTPGTRFDVFPDGQTFILNRSLVDAENEPVNVLMNWTALLDER
jgi:Tol biopolymer transport system component